MATWISKNDYLTSTERDNNAVCFVEKMREVFKKERITNKALAGMLASAQGESGINPGIWEGLDEGNLNVGFGLFQWTPASKIINNYPPDWVGPGSAAATTGDVQCERVKWDMQNNLQWFSNPAAYLVGMPTDPPITFYEFVTDRSLDEKTLATYWLLYYEHPREDLIVPDNTERRQWASQWLEWIETGQHVDPSGPSGGDLLILLAKYKIKNRKR